MLLFKKFLPFLSHTPCGMLFHRRNAKFLHPSSNCRTPNNRASAGRGGRQCTVSGLSAVLARQQKVSSASSFLCMLGANLLSIHQDTVLPMLWANVVLSPAHVHRLAHAIIRHPSHRTSSNIAMFMRQLRFNGVLSSDDDRAAVFVVYAQASALQLLDILSLPANTSCLRHVQTNHVSTLRHLFVRVNLSHNNYTFILDELHGLVTLGIAFEFLPQHVHVPNEMRPLGQAPGAFQHLVCLDFEIGSGCLSSQHRQAMHMLRHSSFPCLQTLKISINHLMLPSATANQILALVAAHLPMIQRVHLNVPAPLVELLLPRLQVPHVYIRSYHGHAPIGVMISHSITNLTLGIFDRSDAEVVPQTLARRFLVMLYGSIEAANVHEYQRPPLDVKFQSLSWPSQARPDQEGVSFLRGIGTVVQALHSVRVHVLDETEQNAFVVLSKVRTFWMCCRSDLPLTVYI
jgi:hypothetical protein